MFFSRAPALVFILRNIEIATPVPAPYSPESEEIL